MMQNKIDLLRQMMIKNNIDYVVVNPTDEYLNEYVSLKANNRAFISDFTGSAGDATIGLDTLELYVDGRYTLQAKSQSPMFKIIQIDMGSTILHSWAEGLLSKKLTKQTVVAVDTDKISFAQMQYLNEKFLGSKIKISTNNLLDDLRKEMKQIYQQKYYPLSKISIEHSGQSTEKKIHSLTAFFTDNNIDAYLLTSLDDIAWISNCRGEDFDYQSTFAAKAILSKEKIFIKIFDENSAFIDKSIEFLPDNKNMIAALQKMLKKKQIIIGFDKKDTTVKMVNSLTAIGCKLKDLPNPIKISKSIKNDNELRSMRSAFYKSDQIFVDLQDWILQQVQNKQSITEIDIENKLKSLFENSSSNRLSFAPICASDKNAAICHYKTGSNNKVINKGELFLVDAGAFYQGGYATDLTRTFLITDGKTKATKRQKFLYTVVLKAAIAGMNAHIPMGSKGLQLDAIVRSKLWHEGLDFAHGTGHGVGINVHEAPPSISPNSDSEIKVGQIFSIEPGIYIENEIGIRIENICVATISSKNENYLQILPLSFAPLDEQLIEPSMLLDDEKIFLNWFKSSYSLSENELPMLR